MEKGIFETLSKINVNNHVEQKNGLTYLSWAWAWQTVKQHYPDAEYTIWKDEYNRPYMSDPELGIMAYTTVTINGLQYEMWLPVMDAKNRAMKTTPYNVNVWDRQRNGWKAEAVQAATMFDINKTIMRCLVKNLAMFGLGLYIYAGEDLPEDLSGNDGGDNGSDGTTAPAQPTAPQALVNIGNESNIHVELPGKQSPELKPIDQTTIDKTTKEFMKVLDTQAEPSAKHVKEIITLIAGISTKKDLVAFSKDPANAEYTDKLWFQNACKDKRKELTEKGLWK